MKVIMFFLPLIIFTILVTIYSQKIKKSSIRNTNIIEFFPNGKERLISLSIWLIGIPTAFIGSYFIWKKFRRQSNYIDQVGKDYLNFWISFCIYSLLIGYIVTHSQDISVDGIAKTIQIVLLPIKITLKIIGAVYGLIGKSFQAPLTIKFIK